MLLPARPSPKERTARVGDDPVARPKLHLLQHLARPRAGGPRRALLLLAQQREGDAVAEELRSLGAVLGHVERPGLHFHPPGHRAAVASPGMGVPGNSERRRLPGDERLDPQRAALELAGVVLEPPHEAVAGGGGGAGGGVGCAGDGAGAGPAGHAAAAALGDDAKGARGDVEEDRLGDGVSDGREGEDDVVRRREVKLCPGGSAGTDGRTDGRWGRPSARASEGRGQAASGGRRHALGVEPGGAPGGPAGR